MTDLSSRPLPPDPDALRRIIDERRGAGRLLVTIDGPCASGKTTLADRLGALCGAPVLHTDDFVIPHALKTPERLAVPGGNCDSRRLVREVLGPWKAGEAAYLRRYSCREDRLLPPEALPGGDLLILEGCYSNLPDIRGLADLRFFLTAPRETRLARLQARETEAALARFHSRWIPLEEAYFRAYGLPDPDCILLGADG